MSPTKRTGLVPPPTPSTFRKASLVFVAVEGARAEPNYFGAIKRLISGPRLKEIRVMPTPIPVDGQAGADGPNIVQVFNRLLAESESFNAGMDERWLVVDRDHKHNKAHQIHQVINDAPAFDVAIAMSNPCFEVWIVAHVRDIDQARKGADDWKSHAKQVCPGYDNAGNQLGWLSRTNIDDAIARMTALRDAAPDEPLPLATVRSDVDRLMTSLIAISARP